MEIVLALLYCALAYWAINKVWYSRHITIVSNTGTFYFIKWMAALVLGVVTIPVALVMTLLGK